MDELLASGSTVSQSGASSTLDLISKEKNPSAAVTAEQRLSDDLDNFLLLLTTQLKNQDPSEPLDVNQFTNQLVAFTGVEQQIATNKNLEEMIKGQQEAQLNNAVNYVGRDIEALGNASAMENGVASFTYELDTPANRVTVLITNSAGQAVYSGQGSTSAGKNVVFWDGVNSFDGDQEPDGTYYINVAARNASGSIIESQTYTTGRVQGARIVDGEIVLEVAKTGVPLNDVVSVREPKDLGTEFAEEDSEDSSLVEDIVDGVTDAVDDII